jgi:hypothetical protein
VLAARLLAQEWSDMKGDLVYHPSDRWRDESHDLKGFMRRAFQLLAYNGLDGDYAEFGCFGARTFRLAWGASQLVDYHPHLWAFDSFQGLPASADPRDAHTGWQEGAMTMSEPAFVKACMARGMPRSAFTTVPGFYEDSLAPDAAGPFPERISFAYIDCDLYTSTVEVLRFLGPRLCHGTVIAFDNYYCYGPKSAAGERLAASEYFAAHDRWQLVPYVQWGWYGMSFVVEERLSTPLVTATW